MSGERESLAAQIVAAARGVVGHDQGSEAHEYAFANLRKLIDEYDSPLPTHGDLQIAWNAAVDQGTGQLEFVYAKGLADSANWLTGDLNADRAKLNEYARTMRTRK